MPDGVTYLPCSPESSDAAWAEETQGVAHHDHDWLIANSWSIYRSDASSNMGDAAITAIIPAPDGCEHIGDIDVVGETLVVPLERCPAPWPNRLYLYDAKTLELRGGSGVPQVGAPWAAVGPTDGRIYSSNFDASVLFVYATGYETGEALRQVDTVRLDTRCERVQGGVFAPDGHLLLLCDDRQHPERAGVLVFELAGDEANLVAQIPPLAAPDADAELEGIDFWDLPGHGQLHYMRLNNDTFNSDNASFQHLSIPTVSSF